MKPPSSATATATHADVSLILVAYHSASLLKERLTDLVKAQANIIIIDNANETALATLCHEYESVDYYAMDTNAGFGRACNYGATLAETPYICFINPDAMIDANALSALKQAFNEAPRAGLVGPTLITNGHIFFKNNSLINPPTPATKQNGVWHSKTPPKVTTPVLNISGACMFTSKARFETLGRFDENLFLFYEDDDLCRRTRNAGLDVIYAPDASVQHLGAKSTPDTIETIAFKAKCLKISEHYVRQKYNMRMIGRTDKALFYLKYILYAVLNKEEKKHKYRGFLDSFVNKG